MNLEQRNLIKECIKNNRSAQSELFTRYKDTLYLVSLKYSRNKVEAEDNLHDAFIAIFSSLKKYQNKGSFEGWMKRITMFKAIDRYKKNKYVPVATFDETLPEENTKLELATLSIDQLLEAIHSLPDQYRMVFNLYQLDDYSHKEVATLLDISEGTSKSNYHRAKQLLQKQITSLIATSKTHNYGS